MKGFLGIKQLIQHKSVQFGCNPHHRLPIRTLFTTPRGRKSEPVIKGVVSPPNIVPEHIRKPVYRKPDGSVIFGIDLSSHIKFNSEKDIIEMRKSCQLARRTLRFAETLIKPGVTTDEIDKKVHEFIIKNNAYPSPLGYGPAETPYPKAICTSVNEIICHGIPDSRPLQDGDIVNVDVTVYTAEGYHGDTSATFFVGQNVDPAARKLVRVAKEAVDVGILAVKPHQPLSNVGEAIEKFVKKSGLSVYEHLVGHGIGTEFHAQPLVQPIKFSFGPMMVPGMIFTIEPAITEGDPQCLGMWDDHWTISTTDGSWSAQFEHTVLVTNAGVEILTKDE